MIGMDDYLSFFKIENNLILKLQMNNILIVFTVALYGGAGIGMAFMAMNLGGTVLQVR